MFLIISFFLSIDNGFSQTNNLETKNKNSPLNFDSIILFYDNNNIKEIYYFKPYKVKSVCFYETGQKKSETNYYSELLDTTFINWYYEHNCKNSIYNCNIDSPDSLEIGWYENGQKEFQCEWVNDSLNGNWLEWYETGELRSITPFKNNQIDGIDFNFNKNGDITSIFSYKNGIANGYNKVYYETGELLLSAYFENGTGVLKLYTKEGKLYEEVYYKDGDIIKTLEYPR